MSPRPNPACAIASLGGRHARVQHKTNASKLDEYTIDALFGKHQHHAASPHYVASAFLAPRCHRVDVDVDALTLIATMFSALRSSAALTAVNTSTKVGSSSIAHTG